MAAVAQVSIEVDASNALSALNQLGQKAQDAVQGIGAGFQGVGGKLQEVGQNFQSIGNIAAAIGVGAWFTKATQTAADFESQTKLLEQGLKNLGASDQELEKLIGAADRLGKQTLFNEDDFIKGFGLLTSFQNIGVGSYEDVAMAAANVAQVSGTSVSGAMMQLAKALNDPVQGLSALSRSGIQFSEDQKTMIKSMVEAGDIAGAQAVIMKELETQYGGTAAAAAGGAAGGMDSLGEAMNDLEKAVGGMLNAGLQPLIEGLTWLINKVLELPDPIKNIVLGFVAFAGAVIMVLPVLATIGQAITGIGLLITKLGPLIGGVVSFLTGGGGIVAAIKAVILVLTGPVGWAIAIAALIAVIWNFRDEIGAFFQWLGQAIADGLKALWDLGEPIRQFWVNLWNGILDIVQSYIQKLSEFWGTIFTFFNQYVIEPIKAGWAALIEFLGKAAEKAGEYIGKAWNAVAKFFDNNVVKPIQQAWKSLIDFLGKAANEAANLINKAWNAIVGFFVKNIVKPLQETWSNYIKFVANTFETIADGLRKAWGTVGDFFQKNIAEPIGKALEAIVKLAENIMPNIGKAIRSAFDGVVAFVKNIVNGMIGAFEGLANAAIRALNGVIKTANQLPGVSISYAPLVNLPRLAAGGFIDQEMMAIIGEAGPEYVIPEGKMLQASMNYLNGKRGSDVIPQSAQGNQMGMPQINIQTGPVMQQDGRNYVSIEDMQKAMRQTAETVLRSIQTPDTQFGLGVF